MRKCAKCKQDKDVSCFGKSTKRPDGLQNYCKECNRQQAKLYYQNNKEELYEIYKDRSDLRKAEMKYDLDKFKANLGCLFCNENEPICLDFHHVGEDKEDQISNLVRKGSYKKLQKEIKKCVLVCANCHRKVHANILSVDKSQCITEDF